MNRRRSVIVAVIAMLECMAAFPAHSDAGEAGAIRGVWTGPWYLGMTSGVARLTVSGDGRLDGTLKMSNNERFGEEAVGLAGVAFVDGRLSFRAIGADGKPLIAQLPLAADGAALKGFAKYGGYNIRFEFMRLK